METIQMGDRVQDLKTLRVGQVVSAKGALKVAYGDKGHLHCWTPTEEVIHGEGSRFARIYRPSRKVPAPRPRPIKKGEQLELALKL